MYALVVFEAFPEAVLVVKERKEATAHPEKLGAVVLGAAPSQ